MHNCLTKRILCIRANSSELSPDVIVIYADLAFHRAEGNHFYKTEWLHKIVQISENPLVSGTAQRNNKDMLIFLAVTGNYLKGI